MKKVLISLLSFAFILCGCSSQKKSDEPTLSLSIKEDDIHTSYAIDVGDGYEPNTSEDVYTQTLSMVSYYFKDNVVLNDDSYVWVPTEPETIEENCYYLDVSELVDEDDPKSGLILGEHTVTVTAASKDAKASTQFKVIVEE